jgi:hypothetical protein
MDEMIVVARRTEVLDVLRLMANGNSLAEACAYVGIDPRTYRKYLGDVKESGVLFQEVLSQSSREQLGIILGYRTLILEKMAINALSENADVKDQIAVFNTIEKHLRTTMDEERIGAGDTEAAESVLSGPVFTLGVSRFSITKSTTTVTVETGEVPNSEPKGDIIDAEVTSPENISVLPADTLPKNTDSISVE